MMKLVSITIPFHLDVVLHAQLKLTVTQEVDQKSHWKSQRVSYVLMLHNESGAHVLHHGDGTLDAQTSLTEDNIKFLIQGLKNDLNMRYSRSSWNLTT